MLLVSKHKKSSVPIVSSESACLLASPVACRLNELVASSWVARPCQPATATRREVRPPPSAESSSRATTFLTGESGFDDLFKYWGRIQRISGEFTRNFILFYLLVILRIGVFIPNVCDVSSCLYFYLYGTHLIVGLYRKDYYQFNALGYYTNTCWSCLIRRAKWASALVI